MIKTNINGNKVYLSEEFIRYLNRFNNGVFPTSESAAAFLLNHSDDLNKYDDFIKIISPTKKQTRDGSPVEKFQVRDNTSVSFSLDSAVSVEFAKKYRVARLVGKPIGLYHLPLGDNFAFVIGVHAYRIENNF